MSLGLRVMSLEFRVMGLGSGVMSLGCKFKVYRGKRACGKKVGLRLLPSLTTQWPRCWLFITTLLL